MRDGDQQDVRRNGAHRRLLTTLGCEWQWLVVQPILVHLRPNDPAKGVWAAQWLAGGERAEGSSADDALDELRLELIRKCDRDRDDPSFDTGPDGWHRRNHIRAAVPVESVETKSGSHFDRVLHSLDSDRWQLRAPVRVTVKCWSEIFSGPPYSAEWHPLGYDFGWIGLGHSPEEAEALLGTSVAALCDQLYLAHGPKLSPRDQLAQKLLRIHVVQLAQPPEQPRAQGAPVPAAVQRLRQMS